LENKEGKTFKNINELFDDLDNWKSNSRTIIS
jgi:hypothetical protein